GAHPFDALVEVQVERVAAIGRHDDFKRGFHLLHRGPADIFAARFVRLEQVAGKHPGDLFLLVQADIEQETGTNPQSDIAHLFPEWISFGDAEGCARIADMSRAMVANDGLEARAAWHDPLRTAAEPGKEMWFDESRDDAPVGLNQMAIDERRRAVAGRAQLNEFLWVFRLVVENPKSCDHLRRQHLFQLAPGVWAMRAKLVQQRDILARRMTDVFQQPGNDPLVGGRPRDIGEGDANTVGRSDGLEQRPGADWILQCREDGGLFVGQTGMVRWPDDRDAVVRQVHTQLTPAIS